MDRRIGWLGGVLAAAALSAGRAEAVIVDHASLVTIDADRVTAFPAVAPVGTGLGVLDLVLLAPSGGGSLNNPVGALNFDNSNTDMPTGASVNANESYITSMGDLRGFYALNFPDGAGGSTTHELAFLLSMAESDATIQLNALDLVVDYSVPGGAAQQDPAANDITATMQNAINSTYTAGDGTRIAKLGGPLTLHQTPEAGPDVLIRTGINPFSPNYADGTRLLVNWQSSGHDGSGELLLASGTFRAEDFCFGVTCDEPSPGPAPEPPPEPQPQPQPGPEAGPVVPEPATWLLTLSGVLGLGWTRSKSLA